MLTVAEALEQVLSNSVPLPPLAVALRESLGHVLAEAIASDIDSPPHDKSLVDGYAVRSGDLDSGEATLPVVEEVVAGSIPRTQVESGTTIRIMTGAPIPSGADAVLMVEQSESLGQRDGVPLVRLRTRRVSPGQNIMRRATAMCCGDVVLLPGKPIRAAEVGLLAEVGRSNVLVHPRPTVAVLSTGNELTPIDRTPLAGQIRNSNEPMLLACVEQAGAKPRGLGIGRDDRDELNRLIRQGLEHDVLVVSGGVSAGVLDLVPGVLQELGVQQVFHKVSLKPGKPLWFGALRSTHQPPRLVFGLPGNPVSSLVCFQLFVAPALRRLAGRADVAPRRMRARLRSAFAHRGERPTYFPAEMTYSAEGYDVAPVAWHGSGDLRGLVAANALAHFPAGDRDYVVGDVIEAVEF